MRFRQQRGFEGLFHGSPRMIEEALWGDLFHNSDMGKPIRLTLSGSGPETRRLEIAKGPGGATLPLTSASGIAEPVAAAPVVFTWTDAKGVARSATPRLGPSGLVLPDTGEDMPDFYFIPATGAVSAVESAGRFSELSKENRQHRFVKTFTNEYPWIKDINVEVHAGAPALFATLKDSQRKVPVPNVSTGINRALSYMLAIAIRPRSIVLIDEIENGIYFTHLAAIWRSVISLLRENDSQLFASTHSHECLEALVEAAKGDVRDVSLWRTDRSEDQNTVSQFSGKDFRAGIEYGQEVR